MFPRIELAVLTLIAATTHHPVCAAKPSGLPGDVTQQCPEGRDRPLLDDVESRQTAITSRTTHDQHVERAAGDRAACHIGRTQSTTGSAEEQEAPPTRQQFRDTSENLGERTRQRELPADTETRRLDMLRSTQPLGTIPQWPLEDGRISYDDERTHATQPIRRMPRADEDTATPGNLKSEQIEQLYVQDAEPSHYGRESTASHCANLPWDSWNCRVLCGIQLFDWASPCLIKHVYREKFIPFICDYHLRASPMTCMQPESEAAVTLQFTRETRTLVPVWPHAHGSTSESQLLFEIVQVRCGTIFRLPMMDCFGPFRGDLILRGQPMLLMVLPANGSAPTVQPQAFPGHGDALPPPELMPRLDIVRGF